MRAYQPTPQDPTSAAMMSRFAAQVEQVPGRCRGCAFRAGSPANRCQRVAGAVQAAALQGFPFYCHHDATTDRVIRGDGTGAAFRRCRGFDALFPATPEIPDEAK